MDQKQVWEVMLLLLQLMTMMVVVVVVMQLFKRSLLGLWILVGLFCNPACRNLELNSESPNVPPLMFQRKRCVQLPYARLLL